MLCVNLLTEVDLWTRCYDIKKKKPTKQERTVALHSLHNGQST